MRRVSLQPAEKRPEPETEEEEPVKVVSAQKAKGRSVAIPVAQKQSDKSSVTPKDRKVGIVHTKAGQKEVYETQAKKYYFLRENGAKSYVTKRITDGRLTVYE